TASWNGSSGGAGHASASWSRSMTAPGTPARASASPRASAVEVLPEPTLPLSSTARRGPSATSNLQGGEERGLLGAGEAGAALPVEPQGDLVGERLVDEPPVRAPAQSGLA